MTNTLNAAQESYAVTLQQILSEDLFAGMLSPVVQRQLARGLAFGMPIERVMRTFSPDRAPQEIADYLKPYAGRVWPYFPISNLLTDQFKEQVLALASAAVLKEFEYTPGRETLDERLG